MSRAVDYEEQGILILQDHDDEHAIDSRHMIAGARANASTSDEYDTLIQIAAKDGKGTIGDIHPWRYWEMVDRKQRPIGSYAQAFAAIVTGGSRGPVSGGSGPSTGRYGGPGDSVAPGLRPPPGSRNPDSEGSRQGSAALRPIRKDDYAPDNRFAVQNTKLPPGIEEAPSGTIGIALAGMEEYEQENLFIPMSIASKLIAVNYKPPGEMGTQVYDLDPENTISDDRWARLQSSWRVVMMPEELPHIGGFGGNALAWQLGKSQQDSLAGLGICYGPVSGGGGGGGGQTTPSDTSWHGEANPNQGHGATGTSPVGPGNMPGTRYGQDVDPHYGRPAQGPPGG